MAGDARARWSTIVIECALVTRLFAAPAAEAHIATDGAGRFMHQSHSRDLNFYNGVDDASWHVEMRDAQLDVHGTMDGSLRYYSTPHDDAVIHAVDVNYDKTGWVGYSYNWGYV